jgi:hypothetical protein
MLVLSSGINDSVITKENNPDIGFNASTFGLNRKDTLIRNRLGVVFDIEKDSFLLKEHLKTLATNMV